jgi:hypothetical protein
VGGAGLKWLEGCYLETISYAKHLVGWQGHIKLGKTHRMIGLLCATLRDELYFLNILSGNRVAILCSVHLL